MKYCLLLCCTVLFSHIAWSQAEPYARDWQEIDSLLSRGLPESAEKKAADIDKKAAAREQTVQMIKAQLYLLNAGSRRSEEPAKDAIEKAESQIAKTSFPEKAIWQSITAQLYWNYYQANRWKILDRTNVSNATTIDDFEQWDAQRFFQKIISLFNSSLQQSQALKSIAIDKYDPILTKGQNTRNLRPTLFDLLAFRAVDFYANDEKDITQPAFHFIMDDKAAFLPASEFIRHKFLSQDSLSLQWKALILYQQILQLHINDASADALIDADLQRLEFVNRYSVLPDKKDLYDKALAQIEKNYAANPLSAMASYKRILLVMQQPDNPDPNNKNAKRQTDVVAVKKKLEAVVEKHPGSEGAVNAAQLLESIVSKSLNVQVEEVVLPQEASKFLLNYKNIPQVWVRVVALDEDSYNKYLTRDKDWLTFMLALKPLQQFNVQLPASQDLKDHSIEIKVDALPAGRYAAIISADKSFAEKDNPQNYAVFQVSGLSMITEQSGRGYVLDRKTGSPISGATIVLYTQSYNNNRRSYEFKRSETITSSADGSFKIPIGNKVQRYQAVTVKRGDDILWLNDYLSFYKRELNHRSRTQTWFFTDRSIYRPGQTIFFKGIMVNIEDGGKKNNVMPNEKTEVIFYDVNGQKISSKKLTTNEFGSFTGSFKAPEGVLTGAMRISNGSGTASVSVEEYKRPKFIVVFDTVKTAYALNDKIKMTGKAKAYAGSAIDNAVVKYRVVRQARWPYWWSYYRWSMPASAEMEIAQGNAVTKPDGSFEITFTAIPDKSVEPKSLPVFNYMVYADVTDVNGETRSASAGVSVGYVSVVINAAIPEKAKPSELDTLNITTANLNSTFVSMPLKLRIAKLAEPERVYRRRLWDEPDQLQMDSLTFRKYFPIDEYRKESNHTTWSVQQYVFEKNINTTEAGNVLIPQNTWKQNGWYVIEMETKDKNGQALTEKKYVQVWQEHNKGRLNDALLVVPQKQKAEPGQQASVHVLSGFGSASILLQENFMDNSNKVSVMKYDGTSLAWNKQVTEADRGGISLRYILVKENRVYQQQAFVEVPWTNKDLQISWETHRDKLSPGATESWTMVISGNKKEKVAAEMVTTLYDASLDAFKPHNWSIYSLFPRLADYTLWNAGSGFGMVTGNFIYDKKPKELPSYFKSYDEIIMVPAMGYGGLFQIDGIQTKSVMNYAPAASEDVMLKKRTKVVGSAARFGDRSGGVILNELEEAQSGNGEQSGTTQASPVNSEIAIRKNLQETAFFFPQLRTDEQGNIRIQFTMSEALTEWKMLAFAHTKDMATGMLDGKIKTQKDLMVMPNLPRFLRQGDEIILSSKISNLSDQSLNGVATLHILDAQTMRPLDLPFRISTAQQDFTVDKERSMNVNWKVHVPESLYQPVIIRITAKAGNFTDGEENALPVITNRMLVTETLPLPVNGNTTKEFRFDKLLHADTSKTLSQYRLTLEYTANPAWYAVQALPYLMEYPYECAEQTFNRYYATALAAHIVDKAPRVKEIFNSWRTLDTAALLSNLEKNQELKSALLEETPWVLEAKNETEQKKRIAFLFEANKLSKSLDANMRKLKEMQLGDGSFSWFKGMRADRYITQYIITGLVRLQHLGVADRKNNMQDIIDRALPYLDETINKDYEMLLSTKADLSKQHISYHHLQYLYLRSFTKGASGKAIDYYKEQAAKFWPSFNPYMKGMAAIALHRDGNKKEAATVIQSLRETAIEKEEMGMYWLQRGHSYWWYEAPIEAQALLIECFDEVTDDINAINKMKIWLLKQKQTQNWGTTKATADACYALLLQGTQWLENDPVVTISMGNKTVDSRSVKQEKGTGYFKLNYAGEEIDTDMGNIKVSVSGNDNSTSWGAVYWQYFENLDKISAAKTPLEVKKQLFIERNSDRGPVLEPVTATNVLQVGDRVKARIEIIVDRDMEYVHLKDMRASCFEPLNVISSYKWQGGLGYYESTKDVSTNFFFSYLRKGKYVFEYPVTVMAAGEFSNGIATIQCMYAPEFSSHTAGIKIKVAAK